MTGTSTWRTMSGTARAAASLFTVTRTSSLPAACSARTWATVPSTSAVSVLVMDWTTMGRSLPTRTPPTSTETVFRRLRRAHGRLSYHQARSPQYPLPARRGGVPRARRDVLQGRVRDRLAQRAVGLELIVVEELVAGGLVGEVGVSCL